MYIFAKCGDKVGIILYIYYTQNQYYGYNKFHCER